MAQIDNELFHRLQYLGIVSSETRNYNVGDSDYSKHIIQPWSIMIEYNLNYFDGDIIKRVLRKKKSQSRQEDYEKIIHICKERIRQIQNGTEQD